MKILLNSFLVTLLLLPVLEGRGLSSILEPLKLENLEEVAPKEELLKKSSKKTPKGSKPAATKKHTISTTEVLQKLFTTLTEQLELEGELKLYAMRNWSPVRTQSSNYSIEFLDYPTTQLKRDFNLNFRIFEGEEPIGQWTLPIRAELWQSVVYTTKRISKNTELLPQLLKTRTVDVLKITQKSVTASTDFELYETATAIAADQPLLWRSITLKPDVRKGKVLDLIAQDGSLRITTKAVAMQNGLNGEFIKVRNLQSRRDIEAQIINENLAKVYF